MTELRNAATHARELRTRANKLTQAAVWADMNRDFRSIELEGRAFDARHAAFVAEKIVAELTNGMSFVERMFAIYSDDDLVKLGFDVVAMRAEHRDSGE